MAPLGFMSPSPMELVVILVIGLLVLGPSRLPETARSIGRGWREFRESLQGLGDSDPEPDPEPRARRDDPAGLPIDPRHVIGDGVVDGDDYLGPDDDSLEGYAEEDDVPDDDFPDAELADDAVEGSGDGPLPGDAPDAGDDEPARSA